MPPGDALKRHAMTIGGAAREAGVGVETIRYYERKGLIDRPLKPAFGGYRLYDHAVVRRVRFIRQAQELGFSLKEIVELLSLKTDPRIDCGDVRDRANAKLGEVKGKIERLERIARALEGLVAACPGSGALSNCSILEELDSADKDA